MLDFFFKIIDQLNEYHPFVKWLVVAIIALIFILILSIIFLPKKKGNVDLSYIKVFSVNVDSNMYQIGVILELTNFTKKPLDITSVNYVGNKIELISRGSYIIPQRNGGFVPMLFLSKKVGRELVGETPMLPNETRTFKFLLPIKQDIIVKHGPLFEIIFWGDWEVVDSKNQKWNISPKAIGNSREIIEKKNWKNMPEPTIELKKNPNVKFYSNETENYILFNRDRTAQINLYGYCKTNYQRSESGTLVVIRGPKNPLLPDNWIILATNYKQLWKDPEKLSLYNSVYPQENNQPRPFAKFAGVLLGAAPEGSTTTRCADKLLIDVKKTLDNQFLE
ncbi:MAG: hypothetical protein GXO88_12020 [Chlorobi bacterium]|nr:hypothetical protein [Chlorobiota bacterium]